MRHRLPLLSAMLAMGLTLSGCCNCAPSTIAPPKLSQKAFDQALATVSTHLDRPGLTPEGASSSVAAGPTSIALTDGGVIAALEDHTLIRREAGLSTLLAGQRFHIPYRGFQGDFADGSGTEARFHGIAAIRPLPGGGLVLTDSLNHRIRKLTPDGKVSTLAGTGTAGSRDGTSGQAEFNRPWGLAVAADGTIFVADSGNHKIRRLSPDGTVTTISDQVPLREPRGLALDADGTLYIADSGNHAVRTIRSDGHGATFAGSTQAGYHDGPRGNAKFRLPSAVALTPSGDVLVADTLNHAIRKISTSGSVTTLAGGSQAKLESDNESDFAVWGHRDGRKEEALFYLPMDLVIDGTGQVLVADSGNQVLRALSLGR